MEATKKKKDKACGDALATIRFSIYKEKDKLGQQSFL